MRKEKRYQSLKWIIAVGMILMMTVTGADRQIFASSETVEGTTADMPEEYSIDRPLLMRGKSLAKASSAVNVNDLDSLKKALASKADEIYVNDKIIITEDIKFPAGKLLLRGYNCCYDTMFEIADGVTVNVNADIDASGDQTKLYTGPVFLVESGGKLRISSGSIYGSVSSNDGGAIVNRGTVEIKGGILQGHTTTKRGGAIYNEGKVSITGGQLLDNRAMAAADVNAGGAVYNTKGGTLFLTGGMSMNNYSLGNGGAVYNEGTLTIDRGRIGGNKGQKKGDGIYSTQDISYTGNYYVNLDEVISEKNVIIKGTSFQNASVITAKGLTAEKGAGNNGNGKLTCTSLIGDIGNDGHIYYNGEGIYNGKVTGEGQFHTSKDLSMDAPAFSNHLAVDKGTVTMVKADMEKHDITVSSGMLKSGGAGTVRVRNILLKGGTYLIENAPFENQMGTLADCKYLDAEKIQCSANSRLAVNSRNNPVLDGKDTFYVPIGKHVSVSQTDVKAALIKGSNGAGIADAGKYERSLHQEAEVTYIKTTPAALYNLRVLFKDENGKQQMFFKDGKETVSVSLNTNSGYNAAAVRMTDAEGFQIEGNDNYGGYRFTSVPAGNVTVRASFADKYYRSVSGSIDLNKDSTIILCPQKLDIDPKGVWWTDEGNYDNSKYDELYRANPGDTIRIANARELAAVAKVVSLPKSGNIAKDLSGITLEVTGDINLKGYQWKPIGTDELNYNGTFDGKKHTIKNMSIGFPDADKSLKTVGLFGSCGISSNILNVNLAEYTMQLKPSVLYTKMGGLVGNMLGKIDSCNAQNGSMTVALRGVEYFTGGLAGKTYGIVNKCSVVGLSLKIENDYGGSTVAGGMIGYANSTITASKVDGGAIEDSNSIRCGGLAGQLENSNVLNCYSSINLRNVYSAGGFAGAIVGGNIKNCYYSGDISANQNLSGGFAVSITGNVTNCYSKANMTGDRIVGFVASVSQKLENCYASGSLTSSGVYASDISGFANSLTYSTGEIKNCYFTGSISTKKAANITASNTGFINSKANVSSVVNNYSLANIIRKSTDNARGFGDLPQDNNTTNNFYYSNIGRATTNNNNTGITRILESSQILAGKRTAVTYTLHENDLPGGAKVTSFRFDDNIPGASIKKLSSTAYEVTPQIDFGVLHLTGEMTVSNAKLAVPTGDVPEGWDFKVSPEDTTMPVSEDLLICKIDYEHEQILAPNIEGLKKNNTAGTFDADGNLLRFNLQDGDFANLIPFASSDLQCAIFIPERPKVPVVSCSVSADKQLLMFTTNKEYPTYTEENAIRPKTGYEYSLDGGKNYQSVTSTADGRVIIPLTAAALSGWTGITDADSIRDARIRLAATADSFRSKAMAEEAGFIVEPPKPSENIYRATYYMNNGTNQIYRADEAVNGKFAEPDAPERKGFQFKGWYTERFAQDGLLYDFTQTASANIKLYARWDAVTFNITTETNAPGKVTHIVYGTSDDREDAAASGTFHEGVRVVLEAEALDEAYTFLCWKEGDTIISKNPVYEMEVTKNQTFTAWFQFDKPIPNAPAIPTFNSFTNTDIFVNAVAGQEYAIRKRGDATYGSWQTSGDFTGLESFTTYQIVTRLPENDEWAASEASQPLEVTTLKPGPAEGSDAPILNSVDTQTRSVCIEARAGEEYAIRQKGTAEYGSWQAEGIFTGLTVHTTYQIVGRTAAIPGIQAAGAVSSALEVYMPKAANTSAPPNQPTLNAKTANRIVVVVRDGQEFAIRQSGQAYGEYQKDGIFNGLQPDTDYEIAARYCETADTAASLPGASLTVRTEKAVSAYTVTFMDGGLILKTQTVEIGGTAQAPAVTKTGYQLSWSIPFSNVTSDLIVRAVWKPNSYTIGFQPNGGKLKGNNKKTVVYGRAYEELPQAVKKGYRFKGWYTKKSGGTKIAEQSIVAIEKDTTYYAQWSKVSPKKASLKSVKNIKGYKAIITWAKMPGADGYRLEYSTDSKFAKKATKTVKVKASAVKSNKPTKTITRLKKGKTYYVRISVYQKDSAGKTYYGKNSTVKKVNIKR